MRSRIIEDTQHPSRHAGMCGFSSAAALRLENRRESRNAQNHAALFATRILKIHRLPPRRMDSSSSTSTDFPKIMV